jgi:hypothetical protein
MNALLFVLAIAAGAAVVFNPWPRTFGQMLPAMIAIAAVGGLAFGPK